MKVLAIFGNEETNKVYFSSAIVSVERVTNDLHGNEYTAITLSNGEELQVVETVEDVLHAINNLNSEITLTGFKYEVVSKFG